MQLFSKKGEPDLMSAIFFCWDILPEKDKEYRDFISNDYIPSLAMLNIDVADGWFKLAGDGQQVMYLGECNDINSAIKALESPELQSIELRLGNYVKNYSKHLAKRNIKSEGR